MPETESSSQENPEAVAAGMMIATLGIAAAVGSVVLDAGMGGTGMSSEMTPPAVLMGVLLAGIGFGMLWWFAE